HTPGRAVRNEGRMPTERINEFHMYYEVAGQGVPLLFVHGGLGGGRGSALFRQHHMPVLAQYVHVIAFDRRAAGLSETPTAGYSFDGFVADMVALLDHLWHERAVLMGHSAGGPQVLQCVLTHPERVSALILAHSAGGPQVLQCALTHPERVRALILSSTATQTVHVPPALASLVTFLGTEGLTHLQQMFTCYDTSRAAWAPVPGAAVEPLAGILQTYLAYHLHGDPLASRLQDITVPALILYGSVDAEITFGEGVSLHAR